MKGAIRKSNRTDNESAKMATGKGVIPGYTGVAAADDLHQIIVEPKRMAPDRSKNCCFLNERGS